MDAVRMVQAFSSGSPEYHRSFKIFLDHTDQKAKALEWLGGRIEQLARRERLIDAGAGNGMLTSWLADRFDDVIAIEPNPSLVEELRGNCPQATVVAVPILKADPPFADCVVCSHVFYYIPRPEWNENAARLVGWLRPGGFLAICIQNPNTDCMRMVDHFIGGRFDLSKLTHIPELSDRGRFHVAIDTVRASIRTQTLQSACQAAEFVLNVLPISSPPRWSDLEDYVSDKFQRAENEFEFSCDQDFLHVTRLA